MSVRRIEQIFKDLIIKHKSDFKYRPIIKSKRFRRRHSLQIRFEGMSPDISVAVRRFGFIEVWATAPRMGSDILTEFDITPTKDHNGWYCECCDDEKRYSTSEELIFTHSVQPLIEYLNTLNSNSLIFYKETLDKGMFAARIINSDELYEKDKWLIPEIENKNFNKILKNEKYFFMLKKLFVS